MAGDTGAWTCDLAHGRAKGFTDNVVDSWSQVHRLPAMTQATLRQFACLGNRAEIATLCMVLGASEDETKRHFGKRAGQGSFFDWPGATLSSRSVQEGCLHLFPKGERAGSFRIGRDARAATDTVGEA